MPDTKHVKASDLTPDIRNANKGTERGRYALETSLRKYGAGRSIVVDKHGRIIAGNKTLETAAEIGLEDVIVVQTDGTQVVAVQRMDLDLAEDDNARMLAYADNRVGELDLDFDAETLMADLAAGLPLDEFWSDKEFNAIIADLQPEGEDTEPQTDRAEELRQQWGVESGQLWQLGDHRLICDDCTDAAVVARVMGGEKANSVVTDPPYGQNQAGVTNDEPEKLSKILSGCIDILPIENAVVLAFSSPRTFPTWLDIARHAGHKFERMLWLYKAAQETFPWRGWLLTSEAILATTVGNGQWQDVHPYTHDCYYKSEVSGQIDDSLGWHGSIKPLDVVEDLIARASPPGAIVYDPFLGSGTTLIACENLNRKCRAVEINPAYVAVTLQRWADHTGQTPELTDA